MNNSTDNHGQYIDPGSCTSTRDNEMIKSGQSSFFNIDCNELNIYE